MNLHSIWSWLVTGPPGGSTGLVLLLKCTVLLALAWLAHFVLAGRNPRWRVGLWRMTLVGVALTAVLALAPPLVTYQIAPAESVQPAAATIESSCGV